MLRARFIPCLLLSDGGLVKTLKFKDEKYVGDPINAVRIFNDHEVDEIVVLDIHATSKSSGPDFDLIKTFADECFMPLSYGGGISTLEQVSKLFHLGVEKVVINSAAIKDPHFITEVAQQFGSQSLIVSIDIETSVFGTQRVRNSSGEQRHIGSPIDFALQMERAGAGEILLNDVSRDGTRKGLNLKMTRQFSDALEIPVVSIGGVGVLNHIREGFRAGASGVAAGSFCVFSGKYRAVLIQYPSQSQLQDMQVSE